MEKTDIEIYSNALSDLLEDVLEDFRTSSKISHDDMAELLIALAAKQKRRGLVSNLLSGGKNE